MLLIVQLAQPRSVAIVVRRCRRRRWRFLAVAAANGVIGVDAGVDAGVGGSAAFAISRPCCVARQQQ